MPKATRKMGNNAVTGRLRKKSTGKSSSTLTHLQYPIGDGQGLEEVCVGVHIILFGLLFLF
jgi:hypothetical protein